MSNDGQHMTRYRLVEDYPERIKFRNGTVHVSFRAVDGEKTKEWILFATKDGDPATRLELMRGEDMMRWARKRFEGFDVVTGSPADKVMRAMVLIGGAQMLRPGEIGKMPPRPQRAGRYH